MSKILKIGILMLFVSNLFSVEVNQNVKNFSQLPDVFDIWPKLIIYLNDSYDPERKVLLGISKNINGINRNGYRKLFNAWTKKKEFKGD